MLIVLNCIITFQVCSIHMSHFCFHTCVFQVHGLIMSHLGIHNLVHNLIPSSTKFTLYLLPVQGAVPVSFNMLRCVNTWLSFRSVVFLEEGNSVYVYVYINCLTVIAHTIICWWWKLIQVLKHWTHLSKLIWLILWGHSVTRLWKLEALYSFRLYSPYIPCNKQRTTYQFLITNKLVSQ